MGGVHPDASTTKLREADDGDPHQFNVTRSIGADEGEEIDGRG